MRYYDDHPTILTHPPAAALGYRAAPWAYPPASRTQSLRRCPECGREFDMLDPTDAAEYAYGHDCEPPADRHAGHDLAEGRDSDNRPVTWCHDCGERVSP